MHDRALDDALEAGRRLRFVRALDHERPEFGVEILGHARAQLVDVDVAGAHDGRRVTIIEQRERADARASRIRGCGRWRTPMRAMQRVSRLLEKDGTIQSYSFSMVHCRGWSCWREKSMTCVTFVSATS